MPRPDPQTPARRDPKPPPRPLDAARLDELALAYTARFATSAAKLESYLRRKLRTRGWSAGEGDEPGDLAEAEGVIAAIVARFVAAGYVDDASFARVRAGGLLRRGYGSRRISQALGEAGIAEDLRDAVLPGDHAARMAALVMARKRGFGPFARGRGTAQSDPARREKQIAAMLRAGHPMEMARWLVEAPDVSAAEQWVAEANGEDE